MASVLHNEFCLIPMYFFFFMNNSYLHGGTKFPLDFVSIHVHLHEHLKIIIIKNKYIKEKG